ncbi:MAG TPA: tetratricopeptide repeat protein [bacterium]|jgi:hypothetical protein
MKIWPLLILIAAGIALGAVAEALSGGLPWGIDDGIKRLTARQWIQTGGHSVSILPDEASPQSRRFFPIPSPFVESDGRGFTAVFPAFFPALGGSLQALLGDSGFYLLPAFGFVLLLFFFTKSLRVMADSRIRLWAAVVLGSSLLFYALTFWEHAPALLCLMPVMNLLIPGQRRGWKAWLGAGVALGIAICLRPETALLLAPLAIVLLMPDSIPAHGGRSLPSRFLSLMLGLAAALAVSGLFEYVVSGRFIPAQASVNWGLATQDYDLVKRLDQTFSMLLNSPMSERLLGLIVLFIFAISIIRRIPLLPAYTLPVIAIALWVWGWCTKGAFGLVAESQGLFIALPWIGILLAGAPRKQQPREPFLILGVGYVILLYLLAPNQPGMHWGPRFLFPAVLPLLIGAVSVLQAISDLKIQRSLMILTTLAALLSGSASVAALAQRGAAGAEIVSVIRGQNLDWLIVNRWHMGADLEPLWAELPVAWTPERGAAEELLITASQRVEPLRLGCLWQEVEFDAAQLPLQIERRIELPQRAGWGGELLTAALAAPSDGRWGELYWHAARRRAESNDLREALWYFEKAADVLPQDPDLIYDTAVCLGRLGRIAEAISALNRVLSLNPHHEAGLDLRRRLTSSR